MIVFGPALLLWSNLLKERMENGRTIQFSDILATEKLSLRKSKPINHDLENKALFTLTSELINSPDSFLNKIVTIAKDLTSAHSAGITLIKDVDGQEILWRQAVAGLYQSVQDTAIEKTECPCGTTLDHGKTQLFIQPGRYFKKFATEPFVEECLVTPICSSGKKLGTFWLMLHNDANYFDSEDARILKAMADYVEVYLRANEAQQLLRNSEKFFRTTFDFALVGMCIARLDGKVMQANGAFCDILGYDSDEISSLDFYSITHMDDRERKRIEVQRMIRGDIQSFRAEKRYIRKDGSFVWVQNSISLVRDLEGRPGNIIVVAQDITEEKNLQLALSAAKNMAEVANLAKSQFLANMSHEIRTPLGAIIGFTNLLQDPEISDSQRLEHLQIVSRSAQALSQLVDDILDLSKVEMGHLEIENQRFSLAELISELTSLLKLKADDKGVGLKFVFENDIPSSIISDPTRLRQILINIIGNAIKFTDQGQITVKVSYATESEKNFLTIRVTDTGPGISPEQQTRLFRPFAQADNSMSRKYGGTGLGLELSRRLGRALGGDVFLTESEVGKGSTFVIRIETLPQSPDEITFSTFRSESSVPKQKPKSSDLNGVKILLVEDSPDNQLLIKYILRKSGALLEFANNGSEGIDLAFQNKYDLVLMDIQMPVMDGYQATTELRKKGFDKPIIALTAHAMKEDRARCIRAGCNSHLTKPIDAHELIQTIYTWSQPRAV